METLRDNLWIWGHDAGCHHSGAGLQWKIPGTNTMGPVEGAEYLGIPNCCRCFLLQQAYPRVLFICVPCPDRP